MFGAVFGVYELRIGDAHPTSSKISDSLKLLNINLDDPYINQGKHMIDYFGYSIWQIGKALVDESERKITSENKPEDNGT